MRRSLLTLIVVAAAAAGSLWFMSCTDTYRDELPLRIADMTRLPTDLSSTPADLRATADLTAAPADLSGSGDGGMVDGGTGSDAAPPTDAARD